VVSALCRSATDAFNVSSTGCFVVYFVKQVFLVRKIKGYDAGTLYAMKVLKKATLKGHIFHIIMFL